MTFNYECIAKCFIYQFIVKNVLPINITYASTSYFCSCMNIFSVKFRFEKRVRVVWARSNVPTTIVRDRLLLSKPRSFHYFKIYIPLCFVFSKRIVCFFFTVIVQFKAEQARQTASFHSLKGLLSNAKFRKLLIFFRYGLYYRKGFFSNI